MSKLVYLKILPLLILSIISPFLAVLSRGKLDLQVREIFNKLTFGEPSLLEHFLTGFFVPGAFILLYATANVFIKTKPIKIKPIIRSLAWQKLRKKIISLTRPTHIVHFAALAAIIYSFLCFAWEFDQFEKNGFFQYNQFAMDLLGCFVFCITLASILRTNSHSARARRSIVLGKF